MTDPMDLPTPERPDIASLMDKALRMHGQGDIASAESSCNDILALDPTHFSALHCLGIISNQRGDFASGERFLRDALRLRPRSPLAHLNLGHALRNLNQAEEALTHYQYSLALKPGDPDALLNQTVVLHDLGRFEEALASAEKLLILHPNTPEGYRCRSIVLKDMQNEVLGRVQSLESEGLHREALALCEEAVDGTEIPEFNFALARNYYALAVKGNELAAWPALLAALEGIAQRSHQQPDVVHAIGICRWVLERFADTHRMDLDGFSAHHARPMPRSSWWRSLDPSPSPDSVSIPPIDCETVERLLSDGPQVRVANPLLAAAPPLIRHGRDSAWIGREARYLLAMHLSSHAAELVSHFLSTDDFPPPGDYDGQYYDRYLLTAAEVHRKQLRAQAAGAPGILVSSLPKSASEFLSYTLAEALQAPVMRMTIGAPPKATVLAKWVAAILRGGAVTHEHFAATKVNLAALREGGLSEIWVLVRDPRAAYWSYVKMQAEFDAVPLAEGMGREQVLHQVNIFGTWIASWIQAKDAGFPVRFLFFRDLTENPAGTMGHILKARGASAFIPKLHEVLQVRMEQGRMSSNFRKGDDEAWRSGVPHEFHESIWNALDPPVKELLSLKP